MRIALDGVLLCDRCADRHIAATTGFPELPHPPDPEKLTGPDGRSHEVRYRLWRSPGGIAAEVEEGPGDDPGYAASVVGDHHDDPDLVAHTLRAKIHDEMSRCYLERDLRDDGWVVAGSEVWGRLEEGLRREVPVVIVDGRRLTWEEFGAAVMPLVGWEFRIVFGEGSWPPPGADTDDELCWADEYEDAIPWDVPAAEAAGVLRAALGAQRGAVAPAGELAAACARLRAGLDSGADPYGQMRWAAGFGDALPTDDAELLLRTVAGVIEPRPADPEELYSSDPDEDAVPGDPFGLEELAFEDWLGVVIELVRAGPGASADPEAMVEHIQACPEVSRGIGDDEEWLLEGAFGRLMPTWEAAGIVDEDWLLTPLGAWVLPRALARAWGADFEAAAPKR